MSATITHAIQASYFPDDHSMRSWDRPDITVERDDTIIRLDVNCGETGQGYELGEPGIALTLTVTEARALATAILDQAGDLRSIRYAIGTALDALDAADEESAYVYRDDPVTIKSNAKSVDQDRRQFRRALEALS